MADKSHLNNLEIHECWPAWISKLFESHSNHRFLIENNTRILSEFAKQIKCHIEVMKGIGLASNQLNKTISKLNHTIESKKETPSPAQNELKFW